MQAPGSLAVVLYRPVRLFSWFLCVWGSVYLQPLNALPSQDVPYGTGHWCTCAPHIYQQQRCAETVSHPVFSLRKNMFRHLQQCLSNNNAVLFNFLLNTDEPSLSSPVAATAAAGCGPAGGVGDFPACGYRDWPTLAARPPWSPLQAHWHHQTWAASPSLPLGAAGTPGRPPHPKSAPGRRTNENVTWPEEYCQHSRDEQTWNCWWQSSVED